MPVELGTGSIEKDVAFLLDAIEDQEEVPRRLLVLAIRLQDALLEQHARRNPN